MKYIFIKNHQQVFPIEKMCKVLEVSSSSYYKWKTKPISNREFKMNIIKEWNNYFTSKLTLRVDISVYCFVGFKPKLYV